MTENWNNGTTVWGSAPETPETPETSPAPAVAPDGQPIAFLPADQPYAPQPYAPQPYAPQPYAPQAQLGFVPEPSASAGQAWYPPNPAAAYPPGPSQPGPQPYQWAPGQMGWAPVPPPPPVPPTAPAKSSSRVLIWVLVGFVVLAVVVGAVVWANGRAGAPNPAPSSAGPQTTALPSLAPRPSTAPGQTTTGRASMNQTVTVDHPRYGPVDYTVTGPVEMTSTISGFYSAATGMVFLIVPVTITYQGSTPFVSLTDQDLVLVAGDGSRNTGNIGAEMFYQMPDGSENEIWLPMFEPGESISGAAIFEIEQANAPGSYLLVGATTSRSAEIGLGI